MLKILVRGYLTRIIKLSTKLETIKQANLIVIDEMSMMTSIILCAIEECLKQFFQNVVNPFDFILVLLIGDLLQLPTICKHSYFDKEKCCKSCHIFTTLCWLNATHHHISSSMRHASDPIYLNFLNIIWCRQPIQIEIDNVLLDCMILEDEILSNINATTTNLCIHQIDVDNYNNLVLEKLFSNKIFDVALDTNASKFEHM